MTNPIVDPSSSNPIQPLSTTEDVAPVPQDAVPTEGFVPSSMGALKEENPTLHKQLTEYFEKSIGDSIRRSMQKNEKRMKQAIKEMRSR